MISKTKISKRIPRKKDPKIIETILACRKNEKWIKIGQIISGSRRKMPAINLDKIEKETKEGDTVVIPGKVLSKGGLSKKIIVAALDFSEAAKEKLFEKQSEAISILEEIKKNPSGRGVKIIR